MILSQGAADYLWQMDGPGGGDELAAVSGMKNWESLSDLTDFCWTCLFVVAFKDALGTTGSGSYPERCVLRHGTPTGCLAFGFLSKEPLANGSWVNPPKKNYTEDPKPFKPEVKHRPRPRELSMAQLGPGRQEPQARHFTPQPRTLDLGLRGEQIASPNGRPFTLSRLRNIEAPVFVQCTGADVRSPCVTAVFFFLCI